MNDNERKEALHMLGASDNDMDMLLNYTANVFSPCESIESEEFLDKWKPVIQMLTVEGASAAINRYLTKEEFQIDFISPETLHIELFKSIGGTIPIITTENVDDFERMVRNVIYKGKEVQNISEMGASFAFGKVNRFIILSNKPYSNVSAVRMGLDEKTWCEKSLVIRKYHECTHYYTKRFMGSSRNNLHDELIADFCGLSSAFGEYRAEWFLKFLGLSEDSDGICGRVKIYTSELSDTAAAVIKKLAVLAARGIEEWSKTNEFMCMSVTERIIYLCRRELLAYV